MKAKGTWKGSKGSVLRRGGRTGPEKNLHFLFTMNNAVWRNRIRLVIELILKINNPRNFKQEDHVSKSL